MLNGMKFQSVGAAYLKALRPTAVLVNGTFRKLCDADRRVLEGVMRFTTAGLLNEVDLQLSIAESVILMNQLKGTNF